MSTLITGVAGFIGSKLALKLLSQNKTVIGIDNLNSYYDVKLKKHRLNFLKKYKKFKFIKIELSNKLLLEKKIKNEKIKTICHLAAQAGVRYSFDNPRVYLKYNLDGFLEILEYCRKRPYIKLVYASSSSVYGKNKKIPFSIKDNVSSPVSLYAATKMANELMAESYKELFSLKLIGLRFFTVYGPWGRPDMAIWNFTESILKDESIKVFGRGKVSRDFTYIDDIIKGILSAMNYKFHTGKGKHAIFNLGNNQPISVNQMISDLEKILGKKAKKIYLPMQPGDVKKTFADIDLSRKELKYDPSTELYQGLEKFVNWFKSYKKII